MEKGYSALVWMTFKQAQELGAHVRKGERGSLVVYASTLHRTDRDEEGLHRFQCRADRRIARTIHTSGANHS
ncbi:ArdC family protein [Rhizobium leguminosarum]|uniref:ArdC family protein n=1 Tax=Rhizobium leguminosarum TaxID=384 RepID=UPI003D7C3287